jgi:hypothetical protein
MISAEKGRLITLKINMIYRVLLSLFFVIAMLIIAVIFFPGGFQENARILSSMTFFLTTIFLISIAIQISRFNSNFLRVIRKLIQNRENSIVSDQSY